MSTQKTRKKQKSKKKIKKQKSLILLSCLIKTCNERLLADSIREGKEGEGRGRKGKKL
jgi:hypothetical protein